MASSLTFSASVGQKKVFSVKNATRSIKKRVSVQTKAASFVRFFFVILFSLFFYVYIIFLIIIIIIVISDLFYFFLSAKSF